MLPLETGLVKAHERSFDMHEWLGGCWCELSCVTFVKQGNLPFHFSAISLCIPPQPLINTDQPQQESVNINSDLLETICQEAFKSEWPGFPCADTDRAEQDCYFIMQHGALIKIKVEHLIPTSNHNWQKIRKWSWWQTCPFNLYSRNKTWRLTTWWPENVGQKSTWKETNGWIKLSHFRQKETKK